VDGEGNHGAGEAFTGEDNIKFLLLAR